MVNFDKLSLDCMNKIKLLEEIGEISLKFRSEGKKIVTLNGSFDILHIGHIYALAEAKKRGDILIVGINSDLSYRQYKDKNGPIISERDRAIILSSLESVDFVVIFEDTNPIKFIKAVKPHVHCNGVEYGKNCIEAQLLKKLGSKLVLLPRIFSTTIIKKKIRNS